MCGSSYDEFAFHKIYHRLNHFSIVDLSAFYFDVLKDRLYILLRSRRQGAVLRRQSGGSVKP